MMTFKFDPQFFFDTEWLVAEEDAAPSGSGRKMKPQSGVPGVRWK